MAIHTTKLNATDAGIFLGLNKYQCAVLFAAWLGWGFDVFDALLLNLVAPNCIPALLGLAIGTPAAKSATLSWTGILTAILLIGWAVGGVLFGRIADRIGRTRTLIFTILLYSIGTAACALSPNIWLLMLFRFISSLGIGGEWAAGATMVAEIVPESRRVEAGAILFTASPLGLLLATLTNFSIAGIFLRSSPETSWRYVLLAGIIPSALALSIRLFLREPDHWNTTTQSRQPSRVRDLFTPQYKDLTRSGFITALIALITYWSCNAFIPIISTGLAQAAAKAQSLDKLATTTLAETWKTLAITYFNFGGLAGTLLTIPIAKSLGRRSLFTIYFIGSSLASFITFGLTLPPNIRLMLYFLTGLTIYGIGSSFAYYLPELFPRQIRATGAGFCYNSGRLIAAGGPFLVGSIASQSANPLASALTTLSWIGVVPLLGLAFLPWIIETRDRTLSG